MKKLTLTAVSLLLASSTFLSACAKRSGGAYSSSSDRESSEPSVMFDNVVERGGALDCDLSRLLTFRAGSGICSTGSVVYTCSGDMINFFDKSSGLSMPLCGKPECDHATDICNAYVGKCDALSIYDGRLYWVSDADDGINSSIMCSDLDGTNRRPVAAFEKKSIGDVISNRVMFFHRGYLYVFGNGASGTGLLSVSLSDGEVKKVFEGSFGSGVAKPVGDEIYIIISSVDGRDLQNSVWGIEHLEAHRVNLTSGKSERIFSFDSGDENISYECWDFMPVPGDGIYYLCTYEFKKTEGKGDYTSTASLMKYSFSTGEVEEVAAHLSADGFDAFSFMDLMFTSECIIGKGGGCINMFDYDGKYIGKVPHASASSSAVYVDDEYMYMREIVMENGSPSDNSYFVGLPLDGGDEIFVG